jgi:predicted ATPase
MPRYVITGGPGAGKTSLLTELEQRNYSCSREVSRQLIMEAIATGSRCLPWIDLPCFAERVFDRMVASYEAVAEDEITFFDRGLPDIIAYLRVAGLAPAERSEQALRYPYARTVFLLPPWKEIYIRDEARWQTFEEARIIYRHIAEVYRSSGYEVRELPKCPVEQRADIILKMLQR